MASNVDSSPLISEQIESTADYHPPAVYGGTTSATAAPTGYLTYYNDLVINADAIADQYIPLSAVPQRGRNPMLFAIGVIPPNTTVTGRLLDRSASIANLTTDGAVDNLGEGPRMSLDESAGLKGSQLPPEFWVQYVEMCKRLGVDPIELAAVIQSESNFNPAAVAIRNGRPVAKGLNQIIKKNGPKLGLSPDQWDTFETFTAIEQLPYVEAYFSKCGVRGADRVDIYAKNFGGFPNPDGSRYASLQYINNYQPEADRVKFQNPEYQDMCYSQNKGLDRNGKNRIDKADLKVNAGGGPSNAIRQRIAEAQTFVDSGQTVPAPVQADAGASDFKEKGSAAADQARQMEDKLANTPLTAENIGAQFTAAQRTQILEVQAALEAMKNTPPLRMLVNPSSFGVKGDKILADSAWTRNGNKVVEHWGDNQDKISASGKVAGFYAIDIQNAVGPGLTRMARNFSQSWQNFQSLALLYKNNGGLHTKDYASGGQEKNLTMMGSIYIYYDGILYIGSFDSLSIAEADTAPFTVEYSFEFTVRAAFLLDQPDPNTSYTYGVTPPLEL